MENSDPADQGAQRNGAERVVQIAAKWNEYLDTLDEPMSQLIRDGLSSTGRADINGKAVIMLICATIKVVRQKLVFEMGRQDRGPRFRIGTALIAVGLGCVSCSLLMNVVFGDMPWPIFVACVLILVTPFAFIAN